MISIIESGAPTTGSHSVVAVKSSNGKLDGDGQSKSTTPIQITPEEVDFEQSLPDSNQTHDMTGKQAKLSLTKYDNEVTTEKVQVKEKIGESYQIISEPHEVSNAIGEGLTEVDAIEANIIDDGQHPPRNNSTYAIRMIKMVFF